MHIKKPQIQTKTNVLPSTSLNEGTISNTAFYNGSFDTIQKGDVHNYFHYCGLSGPHLKMLPAYFGDGADHNRIQCIISIKMAANLTVII